MRDELAGRLLDSLLPWTDEQRSSMMADLLRLAAHKYDSYEGFATGGRFFESLARWLAQFPDPIDRMRLLTFVREDVVFVSREELNHAIACAYPDFVKPMLISRAAQELNVPDHQVKKVVRHDRFRALRRKTLYLGLSDGARLDRFRRSNPELSHEQFWLAPELGPKTRKAMVEKLAQAMEKQALSGEPLFRQVVFVDDFYGSGTSLIRREDGGWGGKLTRARDHLVELRDEGITDPDVQVAIVLYVASSRAEEHIRELLTQFAPGWTLLIVQRLPQIACVTDARLVELSRRFFDPILADEHKDEVPLGYGEVALALVLHHNTPNNSVALLWADSEGREGGLDRRALFPRYERHHVDRP